MENNLLDFLDEVLEDYVERGLISKTLKLLLYMDIHVKYTEKLNRGKLTKQTRNALKRIEEFK